MPDQHNRDMIVPLLALPPSAPALARAAAAGVTVRRARAWEQSLLRSFVEKHFSDTWADEVLPAWARMPVACYLAVEDERIVGFATYNCAHPGLFGPTGVRSNRRGRGLGAALLLRSLEDMRSLGYIYAIIGAVGPADFYEKTCGAMLLPAEWPSYVTHTG